MGNSVTGAVAHSRMPALHAAALHSLISCGSPASWPLLLTSELRRPLIEQGTVRCATLVRHPPPACQVLNVGLLVGALFHILELGSLLVDGGIQVSCWCLSSFLAASPST